jgi:sugar phosphate isomerase/epimerase
MKETLPASIPIGTLIKGTEDCAQWIRTLAPMGFSCFSITFWEDIGTVDIDKLCDAVLEATEETNTYISSLSVYGNPLLPDEKGLKTLESLRHLIQAAPSFHCSVVSGFAGRIPGASVPDSIPKWKETFYPLVELAEQLDIFIAFENCRLGDTWKTGKWNIAINPDAWNLMFSALPSPHIGLEWEPCHQVEALADPLLQADAWADRFIHIHGKDARINRDLLAQNGIYGAQKYYASCFPGNGDTDWKSLIKLLRAHAYTGTIGIEGWNDADWSGDKEIIGQKRALDYLLACTKGDESY